MSLPLSRVLPLVAAFVLIGCGPPPDRAFTSPRGIPGYHVRANAATVVPGNDIGYAVTANGGGGYRLAMVGDGAQQFTGSILCDTGFQSVSPSAGTQVSSPNGQEIDFSAVPGTVPELIDVVSNADPIYVNGLVNNGAASIYFTGADSGNVKRSAYDPVAITSP